MKPLSDPVLIVDDQKTTALVISEVLKRLGIGDAEIASNGSEALSMLAARPYSLVISDCYMEAMNGLELLNQMRSNRTFASVPFIMISVDDDPNLVRVAQQAGADAFLVKPFNFSALQAAVADAREHRPLIGTV